MSKTYSLLFFLITGWVFAQPVVSINTSQAFDQAQLSIETILSEQELPIDRFLDVGQTIRARGEDFMPFGIYVLEASIELLTAIEENPRLAALYPESVVVYEQDGQSHASILDFEHVLSDFELSEQSKSSLENRYDQLRTSLGSVGEISIYPLQQTTELPYNLGQIPDEDLEGSMFFYSSIYQDQNMNLVGEIELASTMQAWLCNARIAKEIFELHPEVAVIAPCRIFAYKEADSVVLGMVNPDYIVEAFPTLLDSETAALGFSEMKEMGATVFSEMGVE